MRQREVGRGDPLRGEKREAKKAFRQRVGEMEPIIRVKKLEDEAWHLHQRKGENKRTKPRKNQVHQDAKLEMNESRQK